jgi:hypothetical protein
MLSYMICCPDVLAPQHESDVTSDARLIFFSLRDSATLEEDNPGVHFYDILLTKKISNYSRTQTLT